MKLSTATNQPPITSTLRSGVRVVTLMFMICVLFNSTGCCFFGVTTALWANPTTPLVQEVADGGPENIVFAVRNCKEHPDGWYIFKNDTLRRVERAERRGFFRRTLFKPYPKLKVVHQWKKTKYVGVIFSKDRRFAHWEHIGTVQLTPRKRRKWLKIPGKMLFTPVTLFLDIGVDLVSASLLKFPPACDNANLRSRARNIMRRK